MQVFLYFTHRSGEIHSAQWELKPLAHLYRARYTYDAAAPRYEFIGAVVAARKVRGWTQTDLAKACGTSQPAIARLESGDQDPKLDTMVKVCNVLELPLTIGKGTRQAG